MADSLSLSCGFMVSAAGVSMLSGTGKTEAERGKRLGWIGGKCHEETTIVFVGIWVARNCKL